MKVLELVDAWPKPTPEVECVSCGAQFILAKVGDFFETALD